MRSVWAWPQGRPAAAGERRNTAATTARRRRRAAAAMATRWIWGKIPMAWRGGGGGIEAEEARWSGPAGTTSIEVGIKAVIYKSAVAGDNRSVAGGDGGWGRRRLRPWPMGKTTEAVEGAAALAVAVDGADLSSGRGGWRRSRIRRRLEKKSAWAAERDDLGSGDGWRRSRLRREQRWRSESAAPVHAGRTGGARRIGLRVERRWRKGWPLGMSTSNFAAVAKNVPDLIDNSVIPHVLEYGWTKLRANSIEGEKNAIKNHDQNTLDPISSLLSVFLLSVWLSDTARDGDGDDVDGGSAPGDGEDGGAAGYGEGGGADRNGGDAARDGTAATRLGTETVAAAAPTWLGQVGTSSVVPATPTSSPTPISILLDDLLLECLTGVPYASLPQLPTTSPRSSPPSRPRRAPPLPPRPLRRAHGEPTDVGVVVVMRTRSRRPPTVPFFYVATPHRRRRCYAPPPATGWGSIPFLLSPRNPIPNMTKCQFSRPAPALARGERGHDAETKIPLIRAHLSYSIHSLFLLFLSPKGAPVVGRRAVAGTASLSLSPSPLIALRPLCPAASFAPPRHAEEDSGGVEEDRWRWRR
uniref:Uncharacterized protein n=1 Tax=Oryza glumipatula TaxID=40148 RepID=A0A0D9Z113_9ORYZ